MNNENNYKKKKFMYKVLNAYGKVTKGYIDTYTKEEAINYLESIDYQIVSIKEVSSVLTMNIGSKKLKYSEISFLLTQLSTYLKAGIPLIDAVQILEKQSNDMERRRTFSNIVNELSKGEKFSAALEKESKVFPKFLINMIKASEATGDLPSTLDSLVDYYNSLDRTRKQTVTAMTYPIIISIFAIMVITFIMLYIVPSFVTLFENNNATLPALTRFIINTSKFLSNNFLIIIIVILVILLIYNYLFKKNKMFRKMMQTIYMRLPIIGKSIIYKETNIFTKTFSNLLSHNVFITESMDILRNLTNNEVYREIINDSLNSLASGDQISDSFRGKWAFPIVAYEMIVTGEKTGELALMMKYVSDYYEELYANFLKRINTFIEQTMIIVLAAVVGVIILSIIIPMFSLYSTI